LKYTNKHVIYILNIHSLYYGVQYLQEHTCLPRNVTKGLPRSLHLLHGQPLLKPQLFMWFSPSFRQNMQRKHCLKVLNPLLTLNGLSTWIIYLADVQLLFFVVLLDKVLAL